MRSGFHSESGPNREGEGRPVEQFRVRRAQRDARVAGSRVKARSRRRGGRGRRRGRREGAPAQSSSLGFFGWLKSLFGFGRKETEKRPRRGSASLDQQEKRVLDDFQKQFGITFRDPGLLKLALTHRSYLSVTGQGPRESNERLEFLGDSVLGLVTSEYLYRRHPDEHEGQLTKTKSLLVSKAILSRRALRMGLGRFVLMSHSEVESGGRQRLSILADAFESVLGAVYLDQGFEVAREYIHKHLLAESDSIVADKRHTNYKSHLQEYVQSTYRTHPVYRIRSENGPDHSKHFMVEVMVGRRTLGEGRGHNKKEAEQAAARDALERVEKLRGGRDEQQEPPRARVATARASREDGDGESSGESSRRRRGRRGGRGRRGDASGAMTEPPPTDELDVVDAAGVVPRSPEDALERAAEPIDAVDELDGPGLEEDDEFEDDEEDLDDEVSAETEAELDDEGALDDLEDDEIVEEILEPDADEEESAEPELDAPVGGSPSTAVTPSTAPPVAPMAWGRSGRRTPVRSQAPSSEATKSDLAIAPIAGASPSAGTDDGALQPHEELHVDPFDLRDEPESEPEVEVVPPVRDSDDEEEVDARIEEMERAMASFGQRKGGESGRRREGFGRRGRRR